MDRYNTAHQIIKRIWIGDVKSSEDKNFLRENNINVVVNCTKDLPHRFEPFPTQNLPEEILDQYFIKYYRVACDDNGRESEIDNFFNETMNVINKVVEDFNKNKNILVHCVAGQQRSCSFALCLLSRLGYSKEQAYELIRKARENSFNYGYEIHFKRAIDKFV